MQRAGTSGQVGALSLNSSKNLSGGEGGLLVTNDERIWPEANLVQRFGDRRVKDGTRGYCASGMGWLDRTTHTTGLTLERRRDTRVG